MKQISNVKKNLKQWFITYVNLKGENNVILKVTMIILLGFFQLGFQLVILYNMVTLVPWKMIVEFIFLTKDNQLNGVGTASALSVLLLAINIWDGRRKGKIDLIAKSRIEWMKVVRPLLANYVTHVSKYFYLYDQFIFESDLNKRNEKNKELTEKMEQIRSEYYQLILYVPDNHSNVLLIRNITLLFGELNNIVNYYDHGIRCAEINNANPTSIEDTVDEYISNLIKETIKDGGVYFKNEWERAKTGN
ncbi:hypothetical protein FE410_05350 [Leuconostoc carnosum]|uniref:hypothetical protein n=1 Tax=Leuconostoc carnosum TaxID=1252 RepID=UPI00123C1FB3|nr:hypothetical protein [Leuconostoc carnosum]KAA8371117.1 hypothetical protein FE414_05345 [Leuconostoc carnosum]KAA8382758.1 hypothetical protein FE410_05350 [Leuconostoc carnosum]